MPVPGKLRPFPHQSSSQPPKTALAQKVAQKSPFKQQPDPSTLTELRAGQPERVYKLPTELLIKKSPYFQRVHADSDPSSPRHPLSFPDFDHHVFELFQKWLWGQHPGLSGPHDFQSMQHYLSLYVLAQKFEIEALQNTAMDLIRAYYREHSMTAPAHRMEYVYSGTPRDSLMRRFLVSTAAYRVLCERDPKDAGIPEAMKGVIARGGELAVDFAVALAELHKNGLKDVRRAPDCDFHQHTVTPKCVDAVAGQEGNA